MFPYHHKLPLDTPYTPNDDLERLVQKLSPRWQKIKTEQPSSCTRKTGINRSLDWWQRKSYFRKNMFVKNCTRICKNKTKLIYCKIFENIKTAHLLFTFFLKKKILRVMMDLCRPVYIALQIMLTSTDGLICSQVIEPQTYPKLKAFFVIIFPSCSVNLPTCMTPIDI